MGNLMNYENHTLTSDFVDLLHSHSFISLINRPTKITSTTATLIDNISLLILQILRIHFRASLLLMFLTIFPSFVLILKRLTVQRKTSYIGEICHRETNLLSRMTLLIWTGMKCTSYLILRLHLGGFTQNYCCYITNISKTKSEIEIQYKENVVDTGIKGCHKNKNKLYKKYLFIPSAANEVKYKTYRNKLNHILQKAENSI